MQSFGALTADDFKAKGKTPVSKLEVFFKSSWVNLCNLHSSEGLVGYWPFDEGSGMVAYDKSKYENDGSLENMSEEDWVDGKVGKCLDFDGDNDFVDWGDDASLQMGAGDYTIEIWFKTSDLTLFALTRHELGGATQDRLVIYVNNGQPILYVHDGVTSFTKASGLSLSDNFWHHLVITFDRTANAIFYCDGVSGITLNIASMGSVNPLGHFWIGKYSAPNVIKGLIDEVRIYNRALTQAEITALFELKGKNYLISANYSKGQLKQTYKPVAATFSAVIDNIDGLFHPQNSDSVYKDYFKVGRKIRFSTGFTQNSTDYLWQWFIGVISEMNPDNANRQVRIQGFDYMQYLSEVQLKSPDNYWGTTITKSTVEDQAEYSMLGLGCNGVYIAYLDGDPIYEGKHWVYDRANSDFIFLPDYVPNADGTNDLVIYYFTDQIPENVIADILVSAGLYADQAAALAAMDYTATGVTIERVMFLTGSKSLTAIQKLCERVDYRFYFTYDGIPVFKPIAEVDRWENRVFTFTKNLIAEPNYFENIDEVKNHIVIEGEKYSESDKYFKTVSGDNFLVGAIEVADGSITEAKMAANAITVTKIADNAIESPKIKAGAVIATKIFAGAIETDKLDGLAVTAVKIAANAIETDKIKALAVTAAKIAANTITADEITAGTITATEIATNTITTIQLKISDSGNTTEKLLMYQGTAVVELIDYKGTNVNHQITNWAYWPTLETNTFLSQAISDVNAGGIRWCALADDEVWAVWGVNAIMCADANTSKDGTASAVIVEEPLKGDPATHTYTNWNENANIWGIRTVPAGSGERMVFFVDEDGDYFYDGGGTGFQDEDDIQLVKDLENILSGKIQRSEMKEKDVFKKHKVVTVSEVYDKRLERKRLDRYISGKKVNMLLFGAVRQLAEKIEALERRIN